MFHIHAAQHSGDRPRVSTEIQLMQLGVTFSILFSFNLCLNLNNHTWLAAIILGSTGLGNKVQTPPEHTKFLGFSLYVSSVKQNSTGRFLNTVYYLTAINFLLLRRCLPTVLPFNWYSFFMNGGK